MPLQNNAEKANGGSYRRFSAQKVRLSRYAQTTNCPGTKTFKMWGLNIENRKDSTRKLLELINEYSKVAGYKINTQKSIAFLYTNNEKTEREIKETIPFTIATKRTKYLGIYLPKETKDLYIGNYTTLVKEIKEDTNRWRSILC